MCWKSKNIYINEKSVKDLFLRKSFDNIYNIFVDMDLDLLRKKKFEYVNVEFHLEEEKGCVYFVKYIEYKGGRTIFSCIKEMVKYIVEWGVDGFGHFTVSLKFTFPNFLS